MIIIKDRHGDDSTGTRSNYLVDVRCHRHVATKPPLVFALIDLGRYGQVDTTPVLRFAMCKVQLLLF